MFKNTVINHKGLGIAIFSEGTKHTIEIFKPLDGTVKRLHQTIFYCSTLDYVRAYAQSLADDFVGVD